jgi:hypothetical protein
MAEKLFDDPDFWYFNEGATSKAECKHCGAKMHAIESDTHRMICSCRERVRAITAAPDRPRRWRRRSRPE